ncbi:hypothetical protein ACSBR1_035340 [Camellia fascicularis]
MPIHLVLSPLDLFIITTKSCKLLKSTNGDTWFIFLLEHWKLKKLTAMSVPMPY